MNLGGSGVAVGGGCSILGIGTGVTTGVGVGRGVSTGGGAATFLTGGTGLLGLGNTDASIAKTFEITRSGPTLLLKRARSGPDTLRAIGVVAAFRANGLTLQFDESARPSPRFTRDAGRARGIEFKRMAPARG